MSLPSPRELAYLGDAVFELHIRRRLLELAASRGATPLVHDLHRQAVGQVRASHQATLLAQLAAELTPEEADLVRRARNIKSNVPRSAKVTDYRQATGFEALLGYLYHTQDHDRLAHLLARVDVLMAQPQEANHD